MTDGHHVGSRAPRIDGRDKVSGAAEFVDDIEQLLELAFGEALGSRSSGAPGESPSSTPEGETPIPVVVTQEMEDDGVDVPTA